MGYNWFSSLGYKTWNTTGGGGVTTALTDRKLIDAASVSGATWDTSVVAPGCEVSFKVPASDAAQNSFQHQFSSSLGTMGFWMRLGTTVTPTVNTAIARCGGSSHQLRLLTTGQFQIGAGAATFNTIFSPTIDTWYWVSFSFDTTTGTHSCDCKVYDTTGSLVAQNSDTAVIAAVAQTSVAWGTNAASSGTDIYFGCPMFNDDITSHPLPRHGATIMVPTGKGTHVPGSGAFQNAATTAITDAGDSSTQSWLDIDEVPPSATDFVRQTVDDANGYLEYTFADVRTDKLLGEPKLVQLVGALYPSTTGGNLTQQRLNDNATITAEATLDASVAANTIEYRLHGYATRPSTGGDWLTNSNVNQLKARIGYMTLQPAQAGWAALYVESLHLLGSSVTGSAALTGTGSLTSAGVRTSNGAAALAGSGTLTVAGVRTRTGAAALTAAGTLSATGTRAISGQATLSGAGVLTASGVRTTFASAALAGLGSSMSVGFTTRYGQAALSANGVLSATGIVLVSGAADLMGTGVLEVDGIVIPSIHGVAHLSGLGSLSAVGSRVIYGEAHLECGGDAEPPIIIVEGGGGGAAIRLEFRPVYGSAHLYGYGTMTATGHVDELAAMELAVQLLLGRESTGRSLPSGKRRE